MDFVREYIETRGGIAELSTGEKKALAEMTRSHAGFGETKAGGKVGRKIPGHVDKKKLLAALKKAGLRTVKIVGDHLDTSALTVPQSNSVGRIIDNEDLWSGIKTPFSASKRH